MWIRNLKKDKSIIVDLFTGQLISLLKCCDCLNISSTFELFTCIQLPIIIDQLSLISIKGLGIFLILGIF